MLDLDSLFVRPPAQRDISWRGTLLPSARNLAPFFQHLSAATSNAPAASNRQRCALSCSIIVRQTDSGPAAELPKIRRTAARSPTRHTPAVTLIASTTAGRCCFRSVPPPGRHSQERPPSSSRALEPKSLTQTRLAPSVVSSTSRARLPYSY